MPSRLRRGRGCPGSIGTCSFVVVVGAVLWAQRDVNADFVVDFAVGACWLLVVALDLGWALAETRLPM